MKKLKWAGYGHNGKNPRNVKPGELANYCLACPQPGVNLPEDWKTDGNWWVASFYLMTSDPPAADLLFGVSSPAMETTRPTT